MNKRKFTSSISHLLDLQTLFTRYGLNELSEEKKWKSNKEFQIFLKKELL
jgi:hypothetical protein